MTNTQILRLSTEILWSSDNTIQELFDRDFELFYFFIRNKHKIKGLIRG